MDGEEPTDRGVADEDAEDDVEEEGPCLGAKGSQALGEQRHEVPQLREGYAKVHLSHPSHCPTTGSISAHLLTNSHSGCPRSSVHSPSQKARV